MRVEQPGRARWANQRYPSSRPHLLVISLRGGLARRVEALEQHISTLKASAAEAKAVQATTEASAAKAQAAQSTAMLETFEAQLRRLESAAGGQAQR